MVETKYVKIKYNYDFVPLEGIHICKKAGAGNMLDVRRLAERMSTSTRTY